MIAIIEGDARRASGNLERLLAADISPRAKMEAHINGLIEAYFERPYLNRLLQKLLREASPEASAKVGDTFVRPVVEARRAIIADGIARGEFRAASPSTAPARISFRRCSRGARSLATARSLTTSSNAMLRR